MTTLSPRQRAYLRSLAHPLSPVVRIGKGGLSESVVDETVRALEAHELIKVRIESAGDERRALAEELADRTDAVLAGTIGKIAMLYRRREENPEIRLPRASASRN